ncbi:MAG TPA: hypothetical protein VGX76_06150, partial [Pirellulales bacterium]|nr:hypothetical protein [Pirellulales bacterium]
RAVTVPPANERNDGHVGARADERGDEEDDDAKANGVRGLRDDEGLVERRRAAEAKDLRNSALQAAAQADGLPTYAGTVDIGLFLKLAIDELNAAAGLSDEQRRKLELAGKIDIERRNDRLEELAQKLIDQQRQAVIAVKDDLVADVRKLLRTPSAAITDDSSRFQKLQSSVLTQEQVLRVAKARGARREFAHEAARQRVVALIAERVPLDDTQWNDASKRLRASWEPFVGEAFDARGIAATIPGELIEPIFDEAQWEMIKPVFGAAGKLEP